MNRVNSRSIDQLRYKGPPTARRLDIVKRQPHARASRVSGGVHLVDMPADANSPRNHISLCRCNRFERGRDEPPAGLVVLGVKSIFQSNEQARAFGNRRPLDHAILRMVVRISCGPYGRRRLIIHRPAGLRIDGLVRLLLGLLGALLIILLTAGECGTSGCGEKSHGSQKHFCELHMLLLSYLACRLRREGKTFKRIIHEMAATE